MFRRSHAVGMVFVTLIFFTLVYFRHPAVLAGMKERLNFTDIQMSNSLMAMDVILGFIFNVNMYRGNKQKRVRCRYSFYIEEEGFQFENYLGFPTDIENAYIYNSKAPSHEMGSNCFSVIIPFKEDGIYSVAIPVAVKVVTELSGEKLVFSGLDIRASGGVGCREDGVNSEKRFTEEKTRVRYKNSGTFAEILSPVTDDSKYLLRLKLLCGHEMEKWLQNCCIEMNFCVSLFDDTGKRYPRKFYIKIKTVEGKNNILSVLPKRRLF